MTSPPGTISAMDFRPPRVQSDPIRPRRHRRSPTAAAFLLSAALVLLCSGCNESITDSTLVPGGIAGGNGTVPHVVRDLDLIRAEGILRVITTPGPTNYLIFDGDEVGFEFELVRTFAQSLGLRCEVVIPGPGEDPFTLLNDGAGDMIAMGLTASPWLNAHGSATMPYGYTRERVILPAEDTSADTLSALDGMTIHVPGHSHILPTLRELRNRRHLRLHIVKARRQLSTDDLIAMVGRGEIPATVANENVALASMASVPGVRLGPALTKTRPVVWLTRSNSPNLLGGANRFLGRQFKMLASAPRRSRIYGILEQRYFIDPRQVRYYRRHSSRPDKSGTLSPWDETVKEKCHGTDLDWALVTALMYEESRFKPGAHSEAGAVGLMQVLPRFTDLDSTQVRAPDWNILSGVQLLDEIHRGFAYLDSLDRWAMTIAAYHSGRGHLNDARLLAMDAGLDPNKWWGNVEIGLQRKQERLHYRNTRHGFYRGTETVDYVRNIFYRTRCYRELLSRYTPGIE